jgi:hypothetical protein
LAEDTHQLVDNNPGFTANGLLWTVRAPTSAVQVNFDQGIATYHMSHLAMTDYGTLANALFGGGGPGLPGPGQQSTVTWSMQWHDVQETQNVRDAAVGFTGTFKRTSAHLEWSMDNASGFHFQSSGAGQKVLSALLGRERNGVYFS